MFRERGGGSSLLIARRAAFQTGQSEGCYGSNWPIAGRGRGNLNPARSGQGQCSVLAGWERRGGRTVCARSLRWRSLPLGAGRQPVVGRSRVWGRGALRWAVGREWARLLGVSRAASLWSLSDVRGHRSLSGERLTGLARPRAGCVFRLSCGRNKAGPRSLPRRRGCLFSSVAAAVCCRPHRHSKLPRGAFPLQNVAVLIKGGRGGTGWGACAV